MINRKSILTALLIFCLLLTGCGRDKGPVQEESIPLPADMAFDPVSQTVTAKDQTNLRSYPSQGEESRVVCVLKNGETAERTAISDSGWSRLEYEGKTYYAISSYLTTDLDYTPPETTEDSDEFETSFKPVSEVVTAKEAVNLRTVPSVTSEDSEIITQLKNGDTANCIGVSDNGWSKLEYEGQICYAVSSYLTTDLNYTPPTETTPAYAEEDGINTVFEDASGSVTAKDTVNLRALPSVTNPDAVVLDQLHNGEVAQRLGISPTGWTKLSYKGKTCYAVSSYLTEDLDGTGETDPDPDGDGIKTQFRDVNEKVTAKVAVNLRAKPSTTDPDAVVVKKLLNGEVVTRTGINDDLGWSRVEFEGQTLYCVSNYLTISNLQ